MDILQTVAHEISGGIKTILALMVNDDDGIGV